ncbi:lipoate-protein ligase A [Haloferula luteola]|uniref:Lipoate-protein ligase A n=1 Tax=Haloferula luteola TaxID=595692 RepID=A0A840VAT7_9BACT|nr:hypothetical protein [Haloferula luteola]MBB5352664.1 lipoate-protein ligase A [Haloferula luteola]
MQRLRVWRDEVLRSGPENMAVDQWLLETSEIPIVRIYGWQGEWASCGYFVPAAEMRATYGNVPWVRRWTGGGMVDHREDWTYTLAIPRGEALAEEKGGASYGAIHQALADALSEQGAGLAADRPPVKGGTCFEIPAEHDVLDARGKKIAGAGQRRSARGLLHQGSVAPVPGEVQVERFLARLAESIEEVRWEPPADRLRQSVRERYGTEAWNFRR